MYSTQTSAFKQQVSILLATIDQTLPMPVTPPSSDVLHCLRTSLPSITNSRHPTVLDPSQHEWKYASKPYNARLEADTSPIGIVYRACPADPFTTCFTDKQPLPLLISLPSCHAPTHFTSPSSHAQAVTRMELTRSAVPFATRR